MFDPGELASFATGERVTPERCACDRTRLVRFVKKNGAICVRYQCLDCGRSVREISRVGIDVAALPEWDEGIRKRASERFRQAWESHRREQSELWWTQYQVYLHSKQWLMLRSLVLQRDGYKCQNCFRPVTDETAHAHHLSYEGYKTHGRSFAFEVITLCKGCHYAWHGR